MRWFLPRFSSDTAEPEEPRSVALKRPSVDVSTPTEALRHFESPGVPIPPSSRVGDPKLKQRESQPIRLWHLWQYGAFAAVKATTLAADVLSHQIWGPRRKSWGIEMTLLSSIMRGVGRYSHLTDIDTIRMLMSIGGLVPVPSDALVTPVSFPVRKRQLRGILTEFDAAENGKRELSGEWVVGKRTWRRLQSEWRARKEGKSGRGQGKRKERIVLYLHGGAYYMFSAATHRLITIPLAKYLDARVFAVDYRLAPETRFPGPLHDAVTSYFRLIDDLHVPPENIIIAGDSAGGGLALGLLMYLRDNSYPLPSGAILLSPWVDLTMSCESWDSNAQYDIIPMPQPGDHLNPILCYLGDDMEKYLTHPYASPLFGDFKGLPPMLIQAGEAEVLRDENTLLAHKATMAGVEVRYELYEDMVHVFQSIPFLDAVRQAFASCQDFVHNFLPQHQVRTPQVFGPSAEKELEDEIDTDAARVVRGDGTETGAGRDALAEPSEDTGPPCREPYQEKRHPGLPVQAPSGEDPSWGTVYLSSGSEDEGDFGDGAVRVKPHIPPTPAPTPMTRPPLTKASSLTRLRATVTTIANAATTSASEPSIRRSQRSHPDISSLVKSWSVSGPANQTRTYKPDGASTHHSDHKRRSVPYS
ncbi:Alpha/Beta hydrolase protein [Cerioporus squamosus]|nr:Alpha/Beta hydrolase protein [Cerioporus squamosus]